MTNEIENKFIQNDIHDGWHLNTAPNRHMSSQLAWQLHSTSSIVRTHKQSFPPDIHEINFCTFVRRLLLVLNVTKRVEHAASTSHSRGLCAWHSLTPHTICHAEHAGSISFLRCCSSLVICLRYFVSNPPHWVFWPFEDKAHLNNPLDNHLENNILSMHLSHLH